MPQRTMTSSASRALETPLTYENLVGTGNTRLLNYLLLLTILVIAAANQAVQRLTAGGSITFPDGRTTAFGGLGVAESQADVQFAIGLARRTVQLRNLLQSLLGGNAMTTAANGYSNAAFDFGIQALDRRGVLLLLYNLLSLVNYALIGMITLLPDKAQLGLIGGVQAVRAREVALLAFLLNALFSENIATAPLVGVVAPPVQLAGRALAILNTLATTGTEGIDGYLPPDSVLSVFSALVFLTGSTGVPNQGDRFNN